MRPVYSLSPRFVSLPIVFAIIFGLFSCFVAAYLPFPSNTSFSILSFSYLLSHPLNSYQISIKSLGLLIFRTEIVLQVVFIVAIFLHIIECLIMLYTLIRNCKQLNVSVSDNFSLIVFWCFQTLVCGYPSFQQFFKGQIRKGSELRKNI